MLGNESQQHFATHWNEEGWNAHEQTMLTCWKQHYLHKQTSLKHH